MGTSCPGSVPGRAVRGKADLAAGPFAGARPGLSVSSRSLYNSPRTRRRQARELLGESRGGEEGDGHFQGPGTPPAAGRAGNKPGRSPVRSGRPALGHALSELEDTAVAIRTLLAGRLMHHA